MDAATAQPLQAQGVAFSTHHNRPVQGRNWWFWYLRASKKVWFRIEPTAVEGLRPLFRYDGRPILHRSERRAWLQRDPEGGPLPVVWGHFVGTDFGAGPAGSRLYLLLWTRWTWLHPEACGRPDRFSVEFKKP